MNQLQQVELAQAKMIAQLDSATAALQRMGRDPLNDAIDRLQTAANEVQERFEDGQIRVLKIMQSLIGNIAGMADGVRVDFASFSLGSIEIPEPQPIEALPPSPVVEVPVQADQGEVKEGAKDEQEQSEPQPISADDTPSRLTEEQQNLVESLIAGPPPANGRGGYGKGNKRKR